MIRKNFVICAEGKDESFKGERHPIIVTEYLRVYISNIYQMLGFHQCVQQFNASFDLRLGVVTM